MNRTLAILLAPILAASGLESGFAPSAWYSQSLETSGNPNNEWYFYPNGAGDPRILVKATGAVATSTVPRKILFGGPPSWLASPAVNLILSKQGTFVPTFGGEGFLIAPHNATLRMAVFDSGGGATIENIDNVSGAYTGISAELDSTGKLHVGYIWNGSTICYARRNGPGNWTLAFQTIPSLDIHETAVVPSTFTAVSLYYTATNITPSPFVRSLWEATPKVEADGKLYITSGSNPMVRREDFVATSLRGSRAGPLGRVYYFGGDLTNSWKLRRRTGPSSTDLEVAGFVSPKSIQVAFGPDGRQRVAWYNETNRRIHYLRPVATGVDVPTLVGYPVVTTGSQTNADLVGFHFSATGVPCLLYRTTNAAGWAAFPNDDFDLNGNGRAGILDTAFNSTSAGMEALPVAPAFPGVATSANRFKIRFPTIGSALFNGSGAVQTTAENLIYGVELSPDLVTWTPLTSGITYTATEINGTFRTFVGVIDGTAPGAFPTRFARMTVNRLVYPY